MAKERGGRAVATARPFHFWRQFRRRRGLPLALSGAMTAAVTCPAQAAAVLEEVVVYATRLPASGSVALRTLRREESTATLPLLTADLLRAQPGAFVQQTTPGQGIPIVRGLKGSQVLHLVDGFRVNNAIFRNAPNQYLALVPAAAVERIDLARGPVGTLYGSDAMGGVVHLHGRRPDFDSGLRGAGAIGWLGASDGVSLQALAQAGSGRHALELGVSLDDIGDRRIGGGERVAPSAYTSRALWWRSRHRLGDGEWGVSAQFLEQPSTPRVDELVAGFGQEQPAASEFFFEPNRREFLQLSAEPAIAAAWADELHLQLGWQRVSDDRRVRERGSAERILEQNSSALLGASISLRKQFGDALELRYGADLTRDEVHSRRQLEALASGARRPVAARFPDGSRMDSVGAYTDLTWEQGASRRVELGLRYSRYRVAVTEAQTGVPGVTLRPDDLSARIGLRQAITPDLFLTANIAQGFRAPNIYDLSALGPRPGNRFNIANAHLAPERITGYDLGLVARRGARALEVSAYVSDYRDRISSVATGETTAGGRQVVQSRNIGRVRIYGVELFATTGVGAWVFDTTLNWTWGESREAGASEPADRIPPLAGRLRAQRTLGAWSVQAVAQYARHQDRLSARDRDDPRIDPAGTAGWWSLNLRAQRPLAAGLELTVGLDNVLDERYREHGSGIDAPGRELVLRLERPLG
jgi:outer membrane receptor protein involved in Fe transport